MLVKWTASAEASCLHATAALLSGQRLVQPPLAEALAPGAVSLANYINGLGLLGNNLPEHLAALAAAAPGSERLADLVLIKTVGAGNFPSAMRSELAELLSELKHAFDHALPNAQHELELRGDPLRHQWEARGPGLLRVVGKLVDPKLIADRAEIILVYPVLGGGGAAHLPYNSVRVEAVLTDPHSQLPEVVRLGWLLAQLQQDNPAFSRDIPPVHLPRMAGLAMIPPVLEAAQHVELAQFDLPAVQLALRAWLGEPPSRELAETLIQWWSTYDAAHPRWAVALGALDEMVEGVEAGGDSPEA